jgi:hypothetical protein
VPRVPGLLVTHDDAAPDPEKSGAEAAFFSSLLGHTSTTMTFGHYVRQEAADGARIRRVDAILSGPPQVERPTAVETGSAESASRARSD